MIFLRLHALIPWTGAVVLTAWLLNVVEVRQVCAEGLPNEPMQQALLLSTILAYSYFLLAAASRALEMYPRPTWFGVYGIANVAGALVFLIVLQALMFAAFFGIRGSSEGVIVAPRDYLYFSMVTFSTLGYGDFQPCPIGRLVAAAHGLYGMFLAPLLLAVFLRNSEAPALDHPTKKKGEAKQKMANNKRRRRR